MKLFINTNLVLVAAVMTVVLSHGIAFSQTTPAIATSDTAASIVQGATTSLPEHRHKTVARAPVKPPVFPTKPQHAVQKLR